MPQHHHHHPEKQHLHLPFTVPHRHPCTVDITIEPDDGDPPKTGKDLLDLWPDPSVVAGYPVLQAIISSPQSRIYASLYGWVQITTTPNTNDEDDASSEENQGEEAKDKGSVSSGSRSGESEKWFMDLYPQFQDVNSPYAIWGAEPTFVDAPGQVARKNCDWTARAFLCYSPDAAMTKTVVPVLGVEWGYWVEEGRVFVKELKGLDVRRVWNGHLHLFRSRFEGWEFREV